MVPSSLRAQYTCLRSILRIDHSASSNAIFVLFATAITVLSIEVRADAICVDFFGWFKVY